MTRLTLLDNDLSYNWKPRLYSGIVKESLIDWLDYHQNEKDEWLRYGAGIYLADVDGRRGQGKHGRAGDERPDDGALHAVSAIWNNTFSYNSGLGIGLYRSSRNIVMHNRVDWNVRGYSHGFYNRGQDSAGLLIYEQSSNNIVAYNSVTHSGDGLFLWAGQSTMDTGEGGANDNLFYATISRTPPPTAWKRRSRATRSSRTASRRAGTASGAATRSSRWCSAITSRTTSKAIAIEHGQDNRIAGNTFAGDTTAIHLWWNRVEPSDWGYPKSRDTRSRDYTVIGQHLRRTTASRCASTTPRAFRAAGMSSSAVDTAMQAHRRHERAGRIDHRDARDAAGRSRRGIRVAPLPGGINAMHAGWRAPRPGDDHRG